MKFDKRQEPCAEGDEYRVWRGFLKDWEEHSDIDTSRFYLIV